MKGFALTSFFFIANEAGIEIELAIERGRTPSFYGHII